MQPKHIPPREEALTTAYRLLSACLCEPEVDLLTEERVHDNLAAALDAIEVTAADRARSMATAMAEADPQDLLVEYARLFIGPGRLPAPPYGSIYLEEGRTVMGESTLAVLAAYREHGFDSDVLAKEPPDHLALELEFLSLLGWRAAEAAAGGSGDVAAALLDSRSEFREQYVASWVPAFAANVRVSASLGYYRNLADCLEITLT